MTMGRGEAVTLAAVPLNCLWRDSSSEVGVAPKEAPGMTADEFITLGLIALVGIVTTAALYIGLAGMLGAAHVVRCAACDHWTIAPSGGSAASCPNCAHPVLLHPLRAFRRRRSPQ